MKDRIEILEDMKKAYEEGGSCCDSMDVANDCDVCPVVVDCGGTEEKIYKTVCKELEKLKKPLFEKSWYQVTINIPKDKLIKDGIQYEVFGEALSDSINSWGSSETMGVVLNVRPVEWKPKEGDRVWRLCQFGGVEEVIFYKDLLSMYELGFIHKTRESAEKMRDEIHEKYGRG